MMWATHTRLRRIPPPCLKRLDKWAREPTGKFASVCLGESRPIDSFCAFVCSKVYKARNGKTGKLMALKRIRMKTEKDGVRRRQSVNIGGPTQLTDTASSSQSQPCERSSCFKS